jgi:hypothetical protein
MRVFTPVTVSASRYLEYEGANILLIHNTDQPSELLESDSRMIAGRNPPISQDAVSENNPAISKESPANK